jgi:hypothetical protein
MIKHTIEELNRKHSAKLFRSVGSPGLDVSPLSLLWIRAVLLRDYDYHHKERPPEGGPSGDLFTYARLECSSLHAGHSSAYLAVSLT